MINNNKQSWIRVAIRAAGIFVFMLSLGGFARLALPQEQPESPKKAVACDHLDFGLSPYVWKLSGAGEQARAEATMPGAYFKTILNRTKSVRLIVDATGNQNCPPSSRPVIEYSIDEGAFKVVQLAPRDNLYSLPLADGLDP